VITALGGDPEQLKSRWIGARQAAEDLSPRATGSHTREPDVSLLARGYIVEHDARAEHVVTEGLIGRLEQVHDSIHGHARLAQA
jgi:hypothetical protein